MALHDVETMNQIQSLLEAIDPTIIVYGEPWMGGDSPLPNNLRADKNNLNKMHLVGAFNDITRDAIKGSVFQASERGWVQGNANDYTFNGVRYGIVGGINHPGTTIEAWHLNPNQTINYATAHDNHTLNDKLRITGITNVNTRKNMQIQSNAIILTSQGISFLHAGVEFMRSKPNPPGRTPTNDEHAVMGFIGNSYESPDVVNQLRWDQKALYHDVFEYYKGLIEIRNTYSHFRMDSAAEISSRLTFLTTDAGLQGIAYRIAGNPGEPDIIVIHSGNPSKGLTFVDLNDGKTYQILSTYEQIHPRGIDTISGSVFVPANTTMILVEQTTRDY
jgi:pullulanase